MSDSANRTGGASPASAARTTSQQNGRGKTPAPAAASRTSARLKIAVLFGLAAAVISIFAFFVRLLPIPMSHWWDEAVYLQHAEVVFSGRTNWDEFALRPPMLSILIAGAFAIHHHVVSASVLVALLGALGVFFIYLLGAAAYDRVVGLIAAALLAVTPYIVTASHWIMTDVPSTTLLIIGFYVLVVATKRDNAVLYALSGLVFAAAVLTRFTSLVPALVVPLYFLVMRVRWMKLAFVAAGGAILMVPYFIWAQLRFGFFLTPLIQANRAVADRVGDFTYYVRHFTEIFPLYVVAGLLIYIVMLLLVVRPFIARETSEVVLGLKIKGDASLAQNLQSLDGVLLLWIALFFVYISSTPHKEPRYILPIAAPLLLLAARGYRRLLGSANRNVRIAAALLLAALLAPALQGALTRLRPPFVITEATEAVEVSRYIVSRQRRGAVVYANHEWPVYAYYTALPTIVPPWDQTFFSEYPKMMRAPGFFIHYKTLDKQPTQAWLDAQPGFRKLREGRETIVYEYRP